ncbi:hypothetical protein HHI36_022340 [Cryptolaemus montrouzieri]|uniref:Uncharacterized protein n=1 Tax=Cryptolaemus montrouzieri TaxID=559131 RepID=A0ABD2MZS9_9CUCU
MSVTDELIKAFKEELSKQTATLKEELIKNEVRQEGSSIRSRISLFEERLENYLKLNDVLEKNNIIIVGLITDDANLVTYTISILNELLEIELNGDRFDSMYKLGNSSSSPIKVKFILYLTKSLVLSKTFKLKGSNVYNNSNLCEENREREKVLKNHLKEERKKNHKAYINNWNLYVNGEQFNVEDVKQLNETEKKEVERGEVVDTSSAVEIVSSNN